MTTVNIVDHLRLLGGPLPSLISLRCTTTRRRQTDARHEAALSRASTREFAHVPGKYRG
jgi:hypothetical protein